MDSPDEQYAAPGLDGSALRVIGRAIVVSLALWAPLLALNAGYPSLEQVPWTPGVRGAVGYSIAVCLVLAIVLAIPTGLVARVVARHLDRSDLERAGAFCGSAAAGAVFIGYAAILVRHGPAASLRGDLIGLTLDLLASSLIGAMIAAVAMLEAHRSGRAWVPYALAIASAGAWAFVTRGLIRGTPAMDTPFVTWLVAAGAVLVGIAGGLESRKRLAACIGGIVLIGAGSLPSIQFRIPPTESGPSTVAAPPAAPNVVIVLIDTWRYDMTDFADPRLGTTPNLTALTTDRSTVFTSAIAPAPATVPTVKALITGFPASHFGLFGWGRMPPPPSSWTIARAFREVGYSTSAFVASDLVRSGGFESGYEHYWCASGVGNVERSFFLQVLLARRDYWRAQELAERLRVFKTRGDVVVERFAESLERDPSRPFFTYIHLIEPHWPYEDRGFGFIPEELRDIPEPYSHAQLEQLRMGDPKNASYRNTPAHREMIGRYQEEVRDADRLVGRIADALRARGRFDDTLLVVVGDHGEEFFEHNGYGHGQDVFEELVHVPMAIRWPNDDAFARFVSNVTTPVSLIDLFPTLTDLLDLPAPRQPFAGRSLRGVLEGTAQEPVGVISETLWGRAYASYRLGDLKLRVVFDERKMPSEGGRALVFDLAADARERAPLKQRDEHVMAFVEEAGRAVTVNWARAREATPADAAGPRPTGNHEDEALERLRALGYLR